MQLYLINAKLCSLPIVYSKKDSQFLTILDSSCFKGDSIEAIREVAKIIKESSLIFLIDKAADAFHSFCQKAIAHHIDICYPRVSFVGNQMMVLQSTYRFLQRLGERCDIIEFAPYDRFSGLEAILHLTDKESHGALRIVKLQEEGPKESEEAITPKSKEKLEEKDLKLSPSSTASTMVLEDKVR